MEHRAIRSTGYLELSTNGAQGIWSSVPMEHRAIRSSVPMEHSAIKSSVPMEHRAIRSTGYLEPWLRKLRMVRERLEKGASEGGSNGWGQSGKSPGVRQ